MNKNVLIVIAVIAIIAVIGGLVYYFVNNNSSEIESTQPTSEETEVTENAENNEVAANEETTSSGSKILVVYYSATGNTQRVAQMIAESTGADLFEIEPTEPYTNEDLNWTNEDSRVSSEHDDESLRDIELVSTTVDNWDEYDTVLIGYPIWWGIAAWPVNNFVNDNDFSGKTVIPFCTSSSSGLGQSGELLEEMAGTGSWTEGMRFSSSVSETEVTEWVQGLNL